MTAYSKMPREELQAAYAAEQKKFDALKAQGLNLNMARSYKPSPGI